MRKPRRARWTVQLRLVPVVVVTAVALGAVAVASPAGAATLRLGHARLAPCRHGRAYCGSLARSLQPGLRGGPRIRIAYEWLPATDRRTRPRGTIVAVEGGPGYPSSGSLGIYSGTFRAVRDRYDVLVIDNRGTGRSALIRCPSLDRLPSTARASGPSFVRRVGACGDLLDRRYRTRDGRAVHASDLFGTAYAVADMHAVLQHLGQRRVELYGDSYGSWFAQAYAARHPGDLSALILDSTYPIRGLDPYYLSSATVGRDAMERVCARSLACRTAAPTGSPVARLATLLARVRQQPITGRAAGSKVQVIGPRRLADLVQNAGSDAYIWRELDAAVRAALAGDDVPLARLAADGAANGGSADPREFSNGAYMAVSCTDYPQLFSPAAAFAERERQLAAAVSGAPAGIFAPFNAAEWIQMSGYSQTYDSCLRWPRREHDAPVLPATVRRLPARVPVLVLGGDLDDLTPLPDARRVAAGIGTDVRVVNLRNTVHVTSEGETTLTLGTACARRIIARFAAAPRALARLDTRCASRIPPVQTPGAYPLTLAAARPATVVSGPAQELAVRRAVTVAAGALADAAIRSAVFGAERGSGLRGGTWTSPGDRLVLHAVRFTRDTRVSGHGTYRDADGATSGRLTVSGAGHPVTITLHWTQRSTRATATVGRTRLVLPAP